MRALIDLLTACHGAGIPAVLVLMPEASAFRALYTAEVRCGIDGTLDKFRRDWHVPLIDARTWVADADFWDGHHLLPPGAMAFTQHLAREMLPLLAEHRVTPLRSSR
jgi:hypothetical protein